MKVGKLSIGPMSKVYRKCTSGRRSPLLYTAILIVLGLSLSLAGCGQLSLTQLLENEEPGELSISPTNAIIPEAGMLDVSGTGGFKPYTYENKGTIGTIDAATGEFIAPSSVSGNYENTEIEVTDSLGSKAETIITVFAPISLSPAVKTIEEGDTVNFTASGGVPAPDYNFYINSNPDPEDSTLGSWSHTFSIEGTYVVEAADSLGSSAIATITVVAAGGELAIEVADTWVLTGGSITVTAINSTGSHSFSTDPPDEGTFDDATAMTTTYHAPDTETVVTIKLEDSGANTATVEIHVVDSAPNPLAFPTSITVLVNEKEKQLTAIGGIEPHTFWLVGEGSLSPHPVQENRIRYNAPSFPTTAYVWVQDALGRQAKATVHVVEG
jgi:hypothetical protein